MPGGADGFGNGNDEFPGDDGSWLRPVHPVEPLYPAHASGSFTQAQAMLDAEREVLWGKIAQRDETIQELSDALVEAHEKVIALEGLLRAAFLKVRGGK